MALTSRASKLQSMLDHYLRITIQDGRIFIGKMIAFDHHLNLVLSDCEEFRKIKAKGKGAATIECEEKRALGLIVLRGETILSFKVEAMPPSSDDKLRTAGLSEGPGMARGAGRGMPLGGPVRGLGGPTAPMTVPQVGRGVGIAPMPMGRGQMPPMPPQVPPMMPMQRPGVLPQMNMPAIPGMPPPPPFGRGMPPVGAPPPQQQFHPPQVGSMPAGFRPVMPMTPGVQPGQMGMMGIPPQMGYPPTQQGYRPSPGSMPPPQPPQRPPQ